MDVILTLFIQLVWFGLAAMGAYLSLRHQKPKHHWYWMYAFIGVGILGIILTGLSAHRVANDQENSIRMITEAMTAATNANNAATNANNASLDAQREVKNARDEARNAKDELARLINKTSKQTTTAILNLGTETKSSIKAIALGPPARRIPSENRAELIQFLSQKPARVRISAITNDAEAFRFAQDWYEILKASGWTIDGNIVSAFMSVGPPQFGMVFKFHGDPVPPNTEPVGYLLRATNALKLKVSGQRLPDIEDGLILLEFYARPPSE